MQTNYELKKHILKGWAIKVTLKLCASEIQQIYSGSLFQREDPACVNECTNTLFMAGYTFGNCQRPVSSLGVCSNIFIQKQICEIVCSIGHRSCKRVMNQENTLVAQLYVLSDAYKRLQLIEKIPFSQKLCYFRRSHFPQCFIPS